MRPDEGRDRLIVALDVATSKEAIALIDRLNDTVRFFKIGLQLFVGGHWQSVLSYLTQRDKQVFLDLKVPDDIGNTIRSVVEVCAKTPIIKFITLSAHVTPRTIRAARAGRGDSATPLLLTVPYLSSLDEGDLKTIYNQDNLQDYIRDRSKTAIDAGCDGLIASGDAIAQLRELYPEGLIVSPGIRPAGAPADDHKRFTTPEEAIRKGADYLVVGRPIRDAEDPEGMARAIIKEIERTRPDNYVGSRQ